ncbi:hypothetical protein [Corallococcus sp. 4LFB]|uniref:hypothetical protein n=1 Tax=Corallococcus sp. 4LFB TaxID=3383249 RepID=UPI003974C83A
MRGSSALWGQLRALLAELREGRSLTSVAPRVCFPFQLEDAESQNVAKFKGHRYTFAPAKKGYLKLDGKSVRGTGNLSAL